MKIKKFLKTVFFIGLGIVLAGLVFLFSVNAYVKNTVKDQILLPEQAAEIEDADCIIVLGCGVWGDRPSPMLEDRLSQGVELYELSAAPKLLMSGDHGQDNYDEVNVMRNFAINAGVPSEDIFMDHAGFSTYETMFRARDIFEAKKVIIVTQEYHLYRALYIADRLGLEAYGVASDPRKYAGQTYRDLREILARGKDFFSCIICPEPTYLGEAIPVSGDGNVTKG